MLPSGKRLQFANWKKLPWIVRWDAHETGWFSIATCSGWWFGCHFLCSQKYWVSNHPNWLIFFRGVAKNHQPVIISTTIGSHRWNHQESSRICLRNDERLQSLYFRESHDPSIPRSPGCTSQARKCLRQSLVSEPSGPWSRNQSIQKIFQLWTNLFFMVYCKSYLVYLTLLSFPIS